MWEDKWFKFSKKNSNVRVNKRIITVDCNLPNEKSHNMIMYPVISIVLQPLISTPITFG